MKPSQIAQIILRLFAISWFVQGVSRGLAGALFANRSEVFLTMIVPGALTAILAIIVWVTSPSVANKMTKEDNVSSSPMALSLTHLLLAAFVGLGLYFCLSSLGSIFSWLNFVAFAKAGGGIFPPEISYQNLASNVVTFVAGVFVILTAPQWARKIAKREDDAAPAES